MYYKRYNPENCSEAEALYKSGEYKESAKVALDAYEKARLDVKEIWEDYLNNPTELAKLTNNNPQWDTTTKQYLPYDEYIKVHKWENDVPPAPTRIAAKAYRALAKISIKNGFKDEAIIYYKEIEKLGELLKSDQKSLHTLINSTYG